MSYFDSVNLLNASDVIINPATEDTLELVRAGLYSTGISAASYLEQINSALESLFVTQGSAFNSQIIEIGGWNESTDSNQVLRIDDDDDLKVHDTDALVVLTNIQSGTDFLDDIAVYSSQISSNTADIDSTLTNSLASASKAIGTAPNSNVLQAGIEIETSPSVRSNGTIDTASGNLRGMQRIEVGGASGDVVPVLKEASGSIAGAIIFPVNAFKDSSGRAVAPRDPVVLEDVAHASGDPLIMAGVRRIDTLASSSVTSGDNVVLNSDSKGALYVNPESTLWSRNDTYTGTANGTTIDASMMPKGRFSIQVVATNEQVGTTAWTVVLEGGNDNANFTTILTHTWNGAVGNASGSTVFNGTGFFPCKYYRSRASGITLGTATNVIAYILGTN